MTTPWVAPAMAGFVDESSAPRGEGQREYLICAAIAPMAETEAIRERLRPLLRPGQRKLHWTDAGSADRRKIVETIAALEPMNVVVTHLSEAQRKEERFRRKCLELLYFELVGTEVFDLTLECRTRAQDKNDRAHIVALQGSHGLDRRMRIAHVRGEAEPMLWIADAVLGAINDVHRGEPGYLRVLEHTIVLNERTTSSVAPR